MTSRFNTHTGRSSRQTSFCRTGQSSRRPHYAPTNRSPSARLARAIACCLPLLAVDTDRIAAQEVPPPSAAGGVQLSEVEKKFDATVRAFEKHLYDAGAFVVDVHSQWSSSGSGKPAQGTNVFRVAVQKGNKFRIEAGSQETGEAQFICVSDGRKIIRLYRPSNYYSQHETSPTQYDLQHDAMTLQTVSGSGVELLIRPQIRAELIAQIAGVQALGPEKLDGKDVIHLQLTMRDRRLFDVWFTAGDKPMLVKLATTHTIPIDNQHAFRLITTSTFQWKVGGPLSDEMFTVSLPADAVRVDDLLTALQDGDIRQLLGKPAPPLELNDLTGKPVRLADVLGKKVVALIFWASWCAPSTHDMETLNTFVTEAQASGAVVLAVNLGEELSQVKATVAEFKYGGTVLLDPNSKSLDSYRIGAIPMTILIGRDGTVQAFHSGSTPEARQSIRQDTTALLSGKTLVPDKK